VIDPSSSSDGSIPTTGGGYVLRFGATNSGEGITSARTSGSTNTNGLDFLTYYKPVFRLYNSGNAGFINSSGVEYMSFNANSGNIGINNTAPTSKLHVQLGNIQITNSQTAPDITKTGLTLGSLGTSTAAATDYSWIQSSSGPLLLNPMSGNTLTTQTNNYVAIGYSANRSVSPGVGYNLLVAGKIMCEELKIKIKTAANWPDYVFASDYKLMSVDSLQNYISQNLHLPNVPSAKEVEENGIMAGEMNGILLKKVEELTLYMIEQNKNISNQSTQNQMYTKAIADQAEQILLLKQQNDLLMKQVDFLMQK
jgi:hypothetical protein